MGFANEPALLTYKQVADCLQLSERTVYTLVKTNQLPCVRLGGSVRIDRKDLDAFIEQSKARN